METKIKEYLEEIEKNKNIEILLACETGSRAWGFPSPDSDYDVRIIYKHHKNWYLSLKEEKDSITYFFENNDIDISGWDLRKSLRLLSKSNPPLLERIQSPIIYKVNEKFLKGINEVAMNSYSKIATMHHYLNMSKNCLDELTNAEEYKLKKFFYALRTSVACKWIIETDKIPPIELEKMLDELNLASKITERIKELIKIKKNVSESYFHKGEDDILDFIKECLALAELNAKNLPKSKGNNLDLDNFFRSTINT